MSFQYFNNTLHSHFSIIILTYSGTSSFVIIVSAFQSNIMHLPNLNSIILKSDQIKYPFTIN